MMIVNEKIGMYTEDEILEHLTEGEGRGFLGRSMYDAIFDKIHTLKTENEQLKQENARLKDKINMAIKYYESNQQECIIGRNKDDKLIKEYYLPAQCSKKIFDILKKTSQ